VSGKLKVSSAQISQILTDSATALRKVAAERDVLKEKVAQLERRDAATKLANEMHNKGINTELELDELVNRLEKTAGTADFAAIERAVDMAGPNMGRKIAEALSDGSPTSGASDLERYILGDLG